MNCAVEANEDDHHHHHHGHDHGDGDGDGDDHHHHTHPHGDPPLPTSVAQSLVAVVDTARLEAFNLRNPPADLPLLFPTVAARRDPPATVVYSHYGPELLLKIPLTAPVKLFSILIRSPPTTTDIPADSPRTIKLYRNNPHLCLDNVAAARPTYQCEHLPADAADTVAGRWVEHHLPRRKFAGTTSLVVLLPDSWAGSGSDPTLPPLALAGIELRGEASALRSAQPAAVLYEAAPRREDHPLAGKNETANSHIV